MNNPVGPLFTGPQINIESQNAKAVAAFTALVIAGRFVPTAGPALARYGLGITYPTTGIGIGATPLAITNLLPQPFGFVPPANYGLTPNFYLPPGSGLTLPSIIPGVKEQKAEFQQQVDALRAQTALAQETARVQALLLNLSTQRLQQLLTDLDAGRGPTFIDPAAARSAIQARIDENIAATLANNAAIQARLDAALKANPPSATTGLTVADANAQRKVDTAGPGPLFDRKSALLTGDP